MDNITINENLDAVITLKFSGFPKPTIIWFKDDQEIITTVTEYYEIVETEETFTLLIKKIKPMNSGIYYAELNNLAGVYKTNKFQLIVNSKLNTWYYIFLFGFYFEHKYFLSTTKI